MVRLLSYSSASRDTADVMIGAEADDSHVTKGIRSPDHEEQPDVRRSQALA
jgi:hypothetical protein